jgi:membrane fusion protein (multidrug efflux system)
LIAYQGVDVASQVAGVVTEIVLESGENVDEGGRLIQLDTSVEVADLASAKATLQEAEVAYQRQVELMQKRVTSEANLDAARAKRDTAYAAVNRIEAIIAQKSILAPFAGRLGIRKVNKGQYVSAGLALVSLQALDPIRVDFPMPEQQIGKLKVGQTVELTVDALPGKVFTGEIETLDARVAQETRTLLVRGTLANRTRLLLPGMFANVTVLAGDPADVITVPRTAVTFTLSARVTTNDPVTNTASALLPGGSDPVVQNSADSVTLNQASGGNGGNGGNGGGSGGTGGTGGTSTTTDDGTAFTGFTATQLMPWLVFFMILGLSSVEFARRRGHVLPVGSTYGFEPWIT